MSTLINLTRQVRVSNILDVNAESSHLCMFIGHDASSMPVEEISSIGAVVADPVFNLVAG